MAAWEGQQAREGERVHAAELQRIAVTNLWRVGQVMKVLARAVTAIMVKRDESRADSLADAKERYLSCMPVRVCVI